MEEIYLEFEYQDQTKNTIRYREVREKDQPPIIGILYVQKVWAKDAKKVTVLLSK